MTDEQKEEQLRHLYDMLDKCGQILAEWDEENPPTYYRREYRRIMRAIVGLEPEKWPEGIFKKKDTTVRDEQIAQYCVNNPCRKCGGMCRQTRKGSLRIICTSCGTKYQLKTVKRRAK